MNRLPRAYPDSILSACNIDQLCSALTAIEASLGLHSVAYLAVTRADKRLLLSNYNPDWTTRYVARGYHLFDPVIRNSFRCTNSFGWSRTSSGRIVLPPFAASFTKQPTSASVTATPSQAASGDPVGLR